MGRKRRQKISAKGTNSIMNRWGSQAKKANNRSGDLRGLFFIYRMCLKEQTLDCLPVIAHCNYKRLTYKEQRGINRLFRKEIQKCTLKGTSHPFNKV